MLNSEEFIYGTCEDCIDLFNSHYAPFSVRISAKLWPCYCGNSPNVSGHLFIINWHNIIFGSLYSILMLIVSHVNLLHIHVPIYAKIPKMIVGAVYLISSA